MRRYFDVFRRFNYTTPKSYLEFISLYKQLLTQKRSELMQAKQRLESGVDKITSVGVQGGLRRARRHREVHRVDG